MTQRQLRAAGATKYETISQITDKVLPLVEAWQNRALASHCWAIWWLDAIHVKRKRDHKIVNTAVYLVMGIDLEGSSFWLNAITELKSQGCRTCSSPVWMA